MSKPCCIIFLKRNSKMRGDGRGCVIVFFSPLSPLGRCWCEGNGEALKLHHHSVVDGGYNASGLHLDPPLGWSAVGDDPVYTKTLSTMTDINQKSTSFVA